jgi:hypothetical protein
MPPVSQYLAELSTHSDIIGYLRAHSNLPGPRGNLELAHAFASLVREDLIQTLIRESKPLVNTPEEFLLFCGVLGLGNLLGKGTDHYLKDLRSFASHYSWRVREAVAAALQLWGDVSPHEMLHAVTDWSSGNKYEMRADAAGICEPRLLIDRIMAIGALDLLDKIMTRISPANPKTEEDRVLQTGLEYCWSVAVSALPDPGRDRFGQWLDVPDKTIRKIMSANLKKNRLIKMDVAWVKACRERLEND